jgi:hypothetical protein
MEKSAQERKRKKKSACSVRNDGIGNGGTKAEGAITAYRGSERGTGAW